MYSASQFVAHRGYAKHLPENSLTAITAAINAGAKFVEIDVQFSADGHAMLYHDADLQRVSGREGFIWDFTKDTLESFSAHEPERFGDKFLGVPISTMEEFSWLVNVKPQAHFYVELKEESIERFGVAHCLKTLSTLLQPVMAQCTLISFDMPATLLAKEEYGFINTGIVFRDWPNRNQLIHAYKADVAFINIVRIPTTDAITADCPIVVYEIDDINDAANALERGASKVETFAIKELIEALCTKQST